MEKEEKRDKIEIVDKDLDFILKRQKDIILLGNTSSLLGWDEETNMPKEGIESRSEQSAIISREIHKLVIDDEFFNAVIRAKDKGLIGDNKLMVDLVYRRLLKSRKIPQEFVEELSKTTTIATSKWREARNKEEFEIFKPHLEKIIELKRKEAAYIGLKGHRYNSLLDGFEEGMTVEELKPNFSKLKKDLVELLDKIKNSKVYKKQKIQILNKKFEAGIQMELARDVILRMGLDKSYSRLDFSEHPFTTKIGYNDVRITTNVRNDPLFSFNSTMHEAGHALYELGMPKEHYYNFLGSEPSTGLHESQSRFWEIMIGQNKDFWKFYFPIFKKKFKLHGDLEQFYKEVNYVSPSLIRIESDEIHYPLHIILRFELEMDLIEEKIKVSQLPKLWNEKMKELIGVVPKSDKNGVMQDVHWSNGYIGYFPTYAIGTIYSSAIFNSINKEIDVSKLLIKGDYLKIRQWLTNKIHNQGSRLLAQDLIKKVTGKGLDIDLYNKYLNEKYKEIYGF